MIEVNLLPGAKRRTVRGGGRGLSLAIPRLPALTLPPLPKIDRWIMIMVSGWIVGPALIAWLVLGIRNRNAELSLSVEQAEQDSARYAALIEATKALKARQDTVTQKLQVIQEIDANRYIWAHIVDELSRALPQYTWLTSLVEVQPGPPPVFQIQGRAGNTFALTRLMNDLERSPFIREVRLASTQRVPEGNSEVYEFMLEAAYEVPPPGLIETVPLFANREEGEE
ncbi:MAG: PilN domain-containing protein [Gemmatimonadetes bacterium]|nr:PilN domain-containing protein [Gemmatimonadota bacterium]